MGKHLDFAGRSATNSSQSKVKPALAIDQQVLQSELLSRYRQVPTPRSLLQPLNIEDGEPEAEAEADILYPFPSRLFENNSVNNPTFSPDYDYRKDPEFIRTLKDPIPDLPTPFRVCDQFYRRDLGTDPNLRDLSALYSDLVEEDQPLPTVRRATQAAFNRDVFCQLLNMDRYGVPEPPESDVASTVATSDLFSEHSGLSMFCDPRSEICSSNEHNFAETWDRLEDIQGSQYDGLSDVSLSSYTATEPDPLTEVELRERAPAVGPVFTTTVAVGEFETPSLAECLQVMKRRYGFEEDEVAEDAPGQWWTLSNVAGHLGSAFQRLTS